MANPLEVAALEYGALGWPVFPLVPGRKNPRTQHGFHDATTDPKQITQWWTRWPTANIGMPTGEQTDTTILDVDVKAWEGKHGDRTLATRSVLAHSPQPLNTRTPGSGTSPPHPLLHVLDLLGTRAAR